MSEMEAEVRSLVVASKVKEIIKDKGLQTSSEAIDVINKRVLALVEEAVTRAQANKRQTVKGQDI